MARARRAARAVLPALLLAGAATAVQAGSLRYCDSPAPLSARQQDRMLRFAAVVRETLEASGAAVALVARSGLDLARFGQRFSHAGISLRGSANAPWSVRQLYYACDEGRPRVFDQGMAGFVLGMNDPALGHVSAVLLPEEPGAALERSALDDAGALRLLGAAYSANAYAFGLRYQNCNQWVAELLAIAWGDASGGAPARARAQAWLREQGYRPTAFELGWRPLMLAVGFVPWLHRDDHPDDDLAQLVFRVSMPASLEDFVRRRHADARRIEFCHAGDRVVVRRGWEPIADGCQPGEGDEVLRLD